MNIREIPGFLSAEECKALVGVAADSFSRATVVGPTTETYHPGRVAESAWIPQDNGLSRDIKLRVAELIGIAACNMEQLSVVRYHEGGEYQPHVDWFDEADPSFMACTLFGGQRVCSVLIYLNDDYRGGETAFPNVGRVFVPQTGKALVWYNHDEHGALSQDNLHAGLPVISGVKHVAIVWVREHRLMGDEFM